MIELTPQKSIFSPEAYRIIENVLGKDAAQQTLYDDADVIELPITEMDFYFPVGDP